MKFLIALVLLLVVFVSPVFADDAVTTTPPGLDPEDPDIVEWLTWVASPAAGVLVAWLLEKTRLNKYVDKLKPEYKRAVAFVVSGALGAAACVLLELITQLPEGSTAVINALLAVVFSQLAHGRLALSKGE